MTVVYIALVLLTVWLAALTLAFVAVTRTIAVRSLSRTGSSLGGFSFDDDGPDVGAAVPHVVRDALAGTDINDEQITLVALSGGCGNCLERATELVARSDSHHMFFLLDGRPGTAAFREIATVLDQGAARYVAGAKAHDSTVALNINSVPFAVLVRDGHVVDKIYLRAGSDLDALTSQPAS